MKNTTLIKSLTAGSLLLGTFIFASCDKGDKPKPGNGNEQAITLDCNYFEKNPNAVLKDNPDAPVDYIVTCKMAINDDVTIEPGVAIAFETDAGFSVFDSGSLRAVGSGNKQITLTGVDKSAGSWGGILFSSNDVKNEFAYVNLEYAGGRSFSGYSASVIINGGSNLKMSNSKISHSATYGLLAKTRTSVLTLNNNTYTQNKSPMRVEASTAGMVSGTDTYTGNTEDKVELNLYTSEITTPTTIHKIGVPYKMVVGSASVSNLNISSDVTIEPGTIIEMGAGAGIKVNDVASLKIEGTPSERIVIRGEQAVAGSWVNISYSNTQSPNNIIRYADIMHAGANPSSSKGAVFLWASPRLSIDNTNFSDILSCAINGYIGGGGINYQSNLTVGANVTYTNCGGEICGD